jgi:hypothetical protein
LVKSLRHRFDFLVGLRGDQTLEPVDKLRFLEGQIVQSFDEWYQDSFVRVRTFANANGSGQESASYMGAEWGRV